MAFAAHRAFPSSLVRFGIERLYFSRVATGIWRPNLRATQFLPQHPPFRIRILPCYKSSLAHVKAPASWGRQPPQNPQITYLT